jgi:hypothetical protein
MDYFSEADAKKMQAALIRKGFDLEGAVTDLAKFALVLNHVFDDLKDEFIKHPDYYLYSNGDGNFAGEFESAEDTLKMLKKI